jgi:hypothetical protein
MAIERYVRANAFSGPATGNGQKKFPVTVTACSTAMPSAFARNLPALTGSAEKSLTRPAPVGILDIRIGSDRRLVVDGRPIAIPRGVKRWIPVRALKKLANAYLGSVLMARRGQSWLRLKDSELVEIPENGERAELRSLPSFQTE